MQRTRRIFEVYNRGSSSGFQTYKTIVIKTAWRGLGKASCGCREMCEILYRSGGRQWRRAERNYIWKEHAMPKDQKEGHLMLSVLGSLCVLDTKPLLAND